MEGALAELFILVTPLHVVATIICLAWPTKLQHGRARYLVQDLWFFFVVQFLFPYVFDRFSPFKPKIIQLHLSISLFYTINYCTSMVAVYDHDPETFKPEIGFTKVIEIIAMLVYAASMAMLVAALNIEGGVQWTPGSWPYTEALFLQNQAQVNGDVPPGPHPYTPHLVVIGPWYYIRNPMAMLSILYGLLLVTLRQSMRGFAYLVLAFGIITAWFKYFEEPALKKRFGRRYQVYHERVPRWIPRAMAYTQRGENMDEEF